MFTDREPDRVEFSLPACLTKDGIYQDYAEELKNAGESVYGHSAFMSMWNKDFPTLKISKVCIDVACIAWQVKVKKKFRVCSPKFYVC